jgi:hypothetical protein
MADKMADEMADKTDGAARHPYHKIGGLAVSVNISVISG